ncbi:MAG: hypothetical protein V4642_04735 [Bacteroidota bacterium]
MYLLKLSFRLARNLQIMSKNNCLKNNCSKAICHYATSSADEEDSGQAGMTEYKKVFKNLT